jgi:hypothetical protein
MEDRMVYLRTPVVLELHLLAHQPLQQTARLLVHPLHALKLTVKARQLA